MERGSKVVSLIQSEFPILTCDFPLVEGKSKLFRIVQNLAEYTKDQMAAYNDKELEHCFKVASEIYTSGDKLAQIAISNVFIYSISRKLEVSLTVSENARNLFLKFFKTQYEKRIDAQYP